jgi:acyl dehydratase
VIPSIHIGESYDRYQGYIDPDAVVAFASATNDPNVLCQTGEVLPAMFSGSLVRYACGEVVPKSFDEGAITGSRGAVHGQHDVNYFAPIQPGETVQWTPSTHSAQQLSSGVIVTTRLLVSDLDDRPLVEHLWSMFYMGAAIASGDTTLGPSAPSHTFPDGAREHLIGTHSSFIERDQAFRYAGVSTDHAPHAVDDEAARSEGFRSKIMQGMCTLSMCAGAVVKVGADGDPSRLRRFAGRLAAPTYPKQDLVVSVFDAGRAPDGGQILAFEARAGDGDVIKHGRAELHPS